MLKKPIVALLFLVALLLSSTPLIAAKPGIENVEITEGLLFGDVIWNSPGEAPVLSDDPSEVIVEQAQIFVGYGEYDYITVTNYRLGNPSKALVIFTGQSLTCEFYSAMAEYFAEQGYSVYVIDRREANVPVEEIDLSFMQDWTVESTLSDYSVGVKAARLHTAMVSGTNYKKVPVYAVGHSNGASLLWAYNDVSILGKLDKRIMLDMVINFDPQETSLIQTQLEQCEAITEVMQGGVYHTTNMNDMLGLAFLARNYPDQECPIQPLEGTVMTNIQVFRLTAGMTYAGMQYPYVPGYHYWTMDPTYAFYVPLPFVDENVLLGNVLNGGAVPYSPLSIDYFVSGLMAGIVSVDIVADPSECAYVGLGGGFGTYGEYYFSSLGIPVQTVGEEGHGSVFSSAEVWQAIQSQIES